MSNNLYQVINEQHLNEIFQDNPRKLIILMFSSKTCGPCKLIKPKFVELSKNHPDCFFIYIDVNNFNDITQKYTHNVSHTPHFNFYFDDTVISTIVGAHEQSLIEVLTTVKGKIDIKRHVAEQREQDLAKHKKSELINNNIHDSANNTNSNNINNINNDVNTNTNQIIITDTEDEMIKKLELLKKLKELYISGVKLSTTYSINSPLDDLTKELNKINQHQNLQISQTSLTPQTPHSPPSPRQQNNIKNQEVLIKKQEKTKEEKLKEIEELSKIHQNVQQQQIYKIEQLRHAQKLKQEQEKRNH